MISLYNTLTRKKEPFKPFQDKEVSIYTCGPTVYNFAHIGNFRAYIFTDILVRYLKFRNFKVRWVMNITDVDDKTIEGSNKEGIRLEEFTKKYEDSFFKDLKHLNIAKADIYPQATKHIKEIQNLIAQLIQNGYAYEKEGSVYFNITKFKKYGELSKVDLAGIKHGARVELDEYEKTTPGDFVLWKAKKEGEPSWNSPWGPGRPGWSIECSAMSMKYLGQTIDLHLGGVDLIFPHHENEIAQSESATGKKFVRYWLHSEHLLVEGKKMAKSAGNFYTLRDLEKQGADPLAFRYLCFQTHYRTKLNFTWEALQAAQNSLNEIKKLAFRGQRSVISQKDKEAVIKALDDDLNTPKALGILHKANNFNLWLEFEPVLGLMLEDRGLRIEVSQEVQELIKQRENFRKAGKFDEADKIRKEIRKKGYEIEDTAGGTRVIKSDL